MTRTTTAAPPATRFDRRLIAPMVLGSILNPVNSSIIAVSLVPIGRAFGAPPSQTAWLVSALYLATAIGQPVMGRLIDVLGPRLLYLIGTAMVGVAGVIGLVAQDLPTLVVARVVLGFGTCAGYPASMHLIRRESRRTGEESPSGVLTTLAVANQTIAVLGPTLGGLLIGVGGWRSTFAVNIPLSLACLWLGSRRLPGRDPEQARGRIRFDLPGVALFAATLVALLLFLMEPRASRWPLLVVAVLAGAAFAYVERRQADPFVDLGLLRGNRPLVTTYVRGLLAATVSYSFLYGFTQWLQEGRGLTASHAGLLLVPVFGTAIVVSALTGRSPRVSGKLVVGATLQVLAWVLIVLVGDGTPLWVLVLVTFVVGIPQGLVNLAIQNTLYHQADPDRIASSAGLLRTSMYLGAVVSAAASGLFLHDGATTAGLHGLSVFVLVVAVLLLVVTIADRSLARIGSTPEKES